MKLRILTALLSLSLLAGTAGAQAVIRIGAPLPMTGGLSPEGQRLKQGHDLWAETVNKAGGILVGRTIWHIRASCLRRWFSARLRSTTRPTAT